MPPDRFRLTPDISHSRRAVQSLMDQVRSDSQRLAEVLGQSRLTAPDGDLSDEIRQQLTEAAGLLQSSWHALNEARRQYWGIENPAQGRLRDMEDAVPRMLQDATELLYGEPTPAD